MFSLGTLYFKYSVKMKIFSNGVLSRNNKNSVFDMFYFIHINNLTFRHNFYLLLFIEICVS